jgi:hypothetical protein
MGFPREAGRRPGQLAYEYSLFAPGDVTSPRVCRDFVRDVLVTFGRRPLVLAATLCTSELVTNVHMHTDGSAMLRVRLTPARLRVSVYDESPDPPVVRPPDPDACHSRGLLLVGSVADSWGVVPDRAGRYAKGVWFELGLVADGQLRASPPRRFE